MPERVAIIPCANYEDGEVQDAVEEAVLLLGGWEALIDLHDTVYVKPNLAGPFHPERAVTTHPAVVRALVWSLRQRGTPRVLAGDSPAGPSNASYQRILYKRTGMEAMAEETGISLDSDTSPVEVRIKGSRVLGHATLNRSIASHRNLISVPKFKTHLFTRMTGAVKNLYGTVHGMMKVAYHTRYRNPEDFSAMLLDLADYLQPRFTLVDAVIGMEGDGPTWGSSRTIGFVVAGVNPLAVDWVLSQMMGFSPNDVPLFRVMAPPEIEVLGTPLRPGILRGFRLPQPNPFPDGLEGLRWVPERMRNGLGRELLLRPHVISESCARCALCVERCPEGAIQLTGEGVFVDYRRCIGCWCCTEVCPTGAVIPRRSLVGRILSKVL